MDLARVLHDSSFYKDRIDRSFSRLTFAGLIEEFTKAGLYAALSTEGPVLLMTRVLTSMRGITTAMFAMHVSDRHCPFAATLDRLAYSMCTSFSAVMWYLPDDAMQELTNEGFNVDKFSQSPENWRPSKD